MRDPYDILGVKQQATDGEIKKAYRKLAKQYHPDSAANDPAAEAKFAQVTAAYDLLGDKDKRQAFDRGEIDAEGNPAFQGFGPFGGGQAHARQHAGAQGFRPEDIFSEIFGGFRGGPQRPAPPKPKRGRDGLHKITISFEDALRGTKQAVRLQNGKSVNVTVKPGIADGQQIRLKGQGFNGTNGGAPGDALVTVNVRPHALFTRDGNDLKLDLPVTLYEAVNGTKIRVPTLDGSVDLKIPALSSSGRVLRLKNKGVPAIGPSGIAGDLLVTLRIVLPDEADPELDELMRKWAENKPYTVRGGSFGNI